MIADAEKRGLIKLRAPRSSSRPAGNTGIALAYRRRRQAAIHLTLVMPETMSIERRRVLAFLGAKLILTPGRRGHARSAVRRAEEIAASRSQALLHSAAVQEPGQPGRSTSATTGPEIWNDTDGGPSTCVVSGGRHRPAPSPASPATSRTTQAARRSRASVAVEPSTSPLISPEALRPASRSSPRPAQDPGHRGRIHPGHPGPVPGGPGRAHRERGRPWPHRDAWPARRACWRASPPGPPWPRPCTWPHWRGTPARPSWSSLPDAAERYLSSVLFEGVGEA